MAQAQGRVAGVNVVRADADANKLVDQLLHYMHAVVHAGEQNALVTERDTGVSQHGAGLGGFFGDFVGMVEVGVEPHGMILAEYLAKMRGDPLRHNNGGTGAEAHYLNMRYLAQLADDVIEHIVAYHQAVAAAEQNVAHFGMMAHIVDAGVYLVLGHFAVMLAGETAARAVTAIHAALVGDEQQHAVGIPMGQTRAGGVDILVQRIGVFIGGKLKLMLGRYGLLTDGVVGIVKIDKGKVIRGDGHAQPAQRSLYAFFFFFGKGYVFLKVLKSFYAVLYLPFPIVPLFIGHVQEQAVFPAFPHLGSPLLFILVI